MMTASAPNGGIGELYAIVIDVNNVETCGTFWSRVLGADIVYQDETYQRLEREGDRLRVLLQKVQEPHQGKNRVHIDLEVSDLENATTRVLELGGRRLEALSESGVTWVVVADPEGNEFCLVKHS